MEDNATRAIMIGVGIFIIMLVITGIILYVNVARDMATTVDKKLNSWDDITISNIMDYDSDIAIKCTGIDFINFIRNNFLRDDIYVTIENVDDMQDLPISWWKNESTNNISDIKIANINANATITMRKKNSVNSSGVPLYNVIIEGDVFLSKDAYVTDSVWKMQRDSEGRWAYVTDGETVLTIGAVVSYGLDGWNQEWKVLGANNGKILLLGKELEDVLFVNRNFDLSYIENIVKSYNYDSQTGAVKGSARCLNFNDIVRLTGIDHIADGSNEANENYGKTYKLSWYTSNSEGENKIIEIESGDSKSWISAGVDGVFTWYDKRHRAFKQVKYPDTLPTLTDDSYMASDVAETGVSIDNLAEDVQKMLTNGSTKVFLMDVSTRYSEYEAKILDAGIIKSIDLFYWNPDLKSANLFDVGSTNGTYQFYCGFRPVIELEQGVKLERVSELMWNVLD